MARCEVCGNDYDKAFQITAAGHLFDSFECAIQVLAPSCAHCGCRIIGHGVGKHMGSCSVVHTVQGNKGLVRYGIASNRLLL
jgi:hypothetical protein